MLSFFGQLESTGISPYMLLLLSLLGQNGPCIISLTLAIIVLLAHTTFRLVLPLLKTLLNLNTNGGRALFTLFNLHRERKQDRALKHGILIGYA